MNTIRTKFLLVIAAFSIAISVFLIARNYKSNIEHLQSQVSLQTELALEFDLAIRDYVRQTLRPFAFDHVSENEFMPEVMSGTYIARSMFERVGQRFPDYIIKFSSDNPRNPVNQAGPAERVIIERFNLNPNMNRWSGEIEIDGIQYYGTFSARRMKESCLRCHGDPTDAPKPLIAQYGNTAGFNRPMGKVVGLDTVAIPIEQYKAAIWKNSLADACFVVFGVGLLFVGVFWYFNKLVSSRLAVIADHFRKASEQDDLTEISLIEFSGNDEIATTSQSYNAFAGRLRNIYGSLEQLVDEKTAVLQQVNADLQSEVEEREKTEIALQQAQQKLMLHIEQTPLGVIEWDLEYRVTSWNPAAEKIFGYSREEAIGQRAKEIILPEKVMPHVEKVCADLLKKQGGGRCTNENLRKDGEIIVCEWYNTPLVDQNGNVIAVASLVQDITAQIKHEKQLERAKQIAENANHAKSEFLANMSHEIRTPMNSIIGFSDLLSDEQLTEDQQSFVETIRDSSNSLLHIINDILDYSKIEAGDMKIDLVPCSLSEILAEVYALMELTAAQKGLAFEIRSSSDIPEEVITDPVRLKQCLINLVNNAIKFTSTGHVLVRVTLEEVKGCSYLKFEVEDTGIGIAADKLGSIFESFQQADGSTTRKYGGTGLGLTITQKLVKLLGGDISVISDPGNGSTFVFTTKLQLTGCHPPKGCEA